MNVQFVSDANGKPTAVLLPIKEWERIQQYLPTKHRATTNKFSSKEQFKEDFREAVREMKQGGGRPVEHLLAEINGLPG